METEIDLVEPEEVVMVTIRADDLRVLREAARYNLAEMKKGAPLVEPVVATWDRNIALLSQALERTRVME